MESIGTTNFGNIVRKSDWSANPFYATGPFQYLLKTLENPRYFDFFRGYGKRSVAWNWLTVQKLSYWSLLITTILSSGLRIAIGFELTNRDPPFIVLILRNIFSWFPKIHELIFSSPPQFEICYTILFYKISCTVNCSLQYLFSWRSTVEWLRLFHV